MEQQPLTNLEKTQQTGGEEEESEEEESEQDKPIPHDLTGKRGLQRIMRFTDNKRFPPFTKGDFEYKSPQNRIFSPEEIGKYSAKIKSICTHIMNGKGVMLVYSQYIDGGLIPLALALEELGFTRYVHPQIQPPPRSLFKHLPPTSQKNKHLSYTLITGDPRLSPNNSLEVNSATDLKNINGNVIKVILISQAGTEGIDFKFIRQVHIMEPWYNMSRIEQIIGRAVRNMSHKELPFQERNVEVFMHGTLLLEAQEEVESADMYVYRVAESKAVKMGKVSRILKESAVDCLLNIQQTQYTVEQIQRLQKHPVSQTLSSGKVIHNFAVGDKPFSYACDYLNTCNYTCKPHNETPFASLNDATYDETFIRSPSTKIMDKVKTLFREKFWFHKKDLLGLVNNVRNYSLLSFYWSLTKLIEDPNEFLQDKYGRQGRLVNIGDFYLFQPLELATTSTPLSFFERSVPLDYKNRHVKAIVKSRHLKETIVREQSPLQSPLQSSMQSPLQTLGERQSQKQIDKKTEKLLTRILEDNNSFSLENPTPLMSWFIETLGVPPERLFMFWGFHVLDFLSFAEKKRLLEAVKEIGDKERKWIEAYFDEKRFSWKGHMAICLFQNETPHFFVWNNQTNMWREAEPEEERELKDYQPTTPIAPFVGFMGTKNNKNETQTDVVFKIWETRKKRNKGADCMGAGKKQHLEWLNAIFKENDELETTFTNETTKEWKGELCLALEFVLRNFSITHPDQVWFMDFDLAKLYQR